MRIAAAIALSAVPATAQAADRPVDIDLPAGTLGHALAILSRQANIDLGVDDPTLQALPVPAVKGRLSVASTLDRLMRSTPATWRYGPNNVWHVRPRQRRPAPRIAKPEPEPEPTELSAADIIVTGSKRGVALSDYPGTVTVLPGDTLAPAGSVAGSDAVAAQAASIGSTHFGQGRNKLFVRGIIDSGFNGPNQAVTGQYLDNARLNYNGADPNLRLYDVASVEVLEGPQGTLYGAGALGGVIRVMPVQPRLDRIEGGASGGINTTAHGDPGGDTAAFFNLPVARDRAALRVVGYAMRDGGYIDNPVRRRKDINGVTTAGGRATLRVLIGDWTVDFAGVAQSIHADDSEWADGAGLPLVRTSAAREPYGHDYLLGAISAHRRWGDLDLVSSFAAVRQLVDQRYDIANPDLPLVVTEKDRLTMLTSETRLSRRGADGNGWVVGVSLVDNNSLIRRTGAQPAGPPDLRQRSDNHVTEITLFGEVGVTVIDGVVASGGLRLTHARLKGDVEAFLELGRIPIFGNSDFTGDKHSENRALPSMAITGKPWPGVVVFARYQEGFRSGGADVSGISGHRYDGDRLRTFELGQRTNLSGSELQFGLTAAYSRWSNILADVVSQAGDPIALNIGNGTIKSLEARIDWQPSRRTTIRASVFWNHSRLIRVNIATVGVKDGALPNVPRLGVQAGARQTIPLKDGLNVSVNADLRYYGGSHMGTGPSLDEAQGNYLDNRLVIRLGDDKRGLSLQATNIQDGAADRFSLGTPYRLTYPQAAPQQPRTIRLGFDTTF